MFLFLPRLFSLLGFASALTVALLMAGCSKKSGVETSDLEKAFQASDASKKAKPEPAAPAATQTQAPAADPVKNYVDAAVAAVRTNDYVGAAVTLQALRAQPTLTPEQLTAVQDTMASLQMKLADRADRGDVQAQRALDAIRGMKRRR